MEVAGEALRDSQLSLLVLPLFLAAGAHLSRDIPAQVNAATVRFPPLRIKLLPAIGEDPRVSTLFQQIACEQDLASDNVCG
jgi:sirohydrochlorin cobaltochelatase